ncbi:N-acetylmuramic acid 6-phosphate etherase [Propioniciclava flava]|uniref:N-acetylmuramic acid 6-phosphate etherase n=1 Tax=Propioniciclava flava TaxID=2072026 RepID=A0A4Q2EJL4_9ACTN|nr:N-acetylmuramic acid 6-phosphate etherase [Propioniciclava flava]RXW33383.1 N-acetylmuramic acid 6-phosphate etherase [Propioniciclava flava]
MIDAGITSPTTEARNPGSAHLDELSPLALLTLMNNEDRGVADAVADALPAIAEVVTLATERLSQGGRLIYAGAGTSGRLGVLDAAECPPTFGTPPGQVVGVLAGGHQAMFEAVEGAEDSAELGASDMRALAVGPHDVVVGIAASGRTPYVIGALDHARSVGAATAALSCNANAVISKHAQVAIEVDNGPEVLTGSTRLKAGTSQKMVLNMISTATMVGLGKVFGNLMVDVAPTNEKLRDRAQRIVMAATDCTRETARDALAAADNHAKTAIVMILCGIDAAQATQRLTDHRGFVRGAVGRP